MFLFFCNKLYFFGPRKKDQQYDNTAQLIGCAIILLISSSTFQSAQISFYTHKTWLRKKDCPMTERNRAAAMFQV